MKRHIVEGVEYLNLSSVSKEYGLSLNSVYKRYSRGHRGDNLIPKKKRKNYIEPKKKYKFIVYGVGYNSYAEACRKHNVDYQTFLNRRRRGMIISQALGIYKFADKPFFRVRADRNPKNIGRGEGRKTVVAGKHFKSLSEVARAYNLTAHLLASRIKSGQTIEQAVGLETYDTKISIKYKGKIYKNYSDLAKYYNIPHRLLYGRIKRGLSTSEAIALGNKRTSWSTGRYNEKILKRNPNLASKPAFLYFVSIIIDGQKRHKIGITTQKIKTRLKLQDYKILKAVKLTLIECYRLEQQILKSYSKYLDKNMTPDKLEGYGEIFDFPQDMVNQVLKILKNFSH